MISIFPNLEALSHAAAGLIVEKSNQAIKAHSRFSFVLAGGSTPRRTYELLGSPPYRDQIQWEEVHMFWGDERCVPLDDPRSNANMSYKALLNKVPIPTGQIHPMDCLEDPAEAALEYESLLQEFFQDQTPGFDLILLGLGEDGHTASLFPGTQVLEERQRWVREVTVKGHEFHRITLTPAVINQAVTVAFLVSGADKAHALQQVRKGAEDPERFPAQLIKPVDGQLIWLVDQEAADQNHDNSEGV